MGKITHEDIEMGQMIFGNPVGEYQCPDLVEALVLHILNELDRVYWNVNQKQRDEYRDLNFHGIEYKHYYWGEDEKEASKPNFKYKEVELRWYKHFGRSMTLNCEKTEKEWNEWFEDCLKVLRKVDRDNFEGFEKQTTTKERNKDEK